MRFLNWIGKNPNIISLVVGIGLVVSGYTEQGILLIGKGV